MRFVSPTWGAMTAEEITDNIRAYLNEEPRSRYKVIIGTDSHTNRQGSLFVTALVIHRVGKGARFFFRKMRHKPIQDLRHRIYKETEYSLELTELLKQNGISELLADHPFEIHIDIGQQGETKKLIQEIVGWVTSVGYVAKFKPHSFGASAVADRFTS